MIKKILVTLLILTFIASPLKAVLAYEGAESLTEAPATPSLENTETAFENPQGAEPVIDAPEAEENTQITPVWFVIIVISPEYAAQLDQSGFGEGVGLGATTTYTYATGTAAYLNPHAVATTTVATSTSFVYDNNGNLTSTKYGTSTLTSYTWDYNNRMTQAVGSSATSTYSYDAWGQRVSMTLATTSSAMTYYPSKGYNITGSVPTKNIFLPDGTLIATVVGTGATTTVSYVHTDHLGGMNVATSDGGSPTVVELADYYPYGNARIDEQSGLNSQRKFANYEFDPASNLNYLNQRYYNGTNANFLSQDPVFWDLSQLEIQLADPQSWNSYSYARNNPLKYNDPDGQFWDTVVDVGLTSIDVFRYGKNLADAAAGGITSGIGVATNNQRLTNIGDTQLSQGVQGMKNMGDDLALDAAGTLIPFVPVAGLKVLNKADDVIGAGKSINNLRGTANPTIKEAVEYGKQQHKLMDYGQGVLKEQKIGNYRVDGIDKISKTIYELKPNTQQSINRGMKQLQNYVNTANKLLGEGYKGVLKTYQSLTKIIK